MTGILIYDDNDNSLPYEVEVKNVYVESIGKTIPYYYTLKIKTPIIFNIKIEKTNYYPFKTVLNLYDYDNDKKYSIFDETFVSIDLGRFPLLSTTKNNGITLAWGQYPYDLDAYLTNPTGEKTYYNNRETYFSMVDIDDKMSYGPETISINYWTDINADHDDDNKINTTFKYDVNWFKDGNENDTNIKVNSMNASVHFFIDPSQSETIIYPKDLDTQNRKDQNWRVFELDVLSTYDRYKLNDNDYIISKYINEDVIADPSYYIIYEECISLKEFYFNVLKNYDFTFKITDDKGEDFSKYFSISKVNIKRKESNNNHDFYGFHYLTPNHDESYCSIINNKNKNINGNYFYNNQQYNNRNVFYNGSYYIYYNGRWLIGKELSNSKYDYQSANSQLSSLFTNKNDSSDNFNLTFNNQFINYNDSNSFNDGNQSFINTSNLTIYAYLNEEQRDLNLIYKSISFSSLRSESYRYDYVNENGNSTYQYIYKSKSFSSETLFSGKMIPFVMYDLHGNIINDVKYRWNYNENRLYIEVLNRKTKLKEVTYIEYILGISTNIHRSQLIDKNGYECKSNLENLSWYIYLDKTNLSKNIISQKINEDEMHFVGFFTLKNEKSNIILARPKLFEIHPVPEKENIKNTTLTKDMLHENVILINFKNFNIIDSQCLINYENLKISKVEGDEIPRELYDELLIGQLLEKKVNLIKIVNENNEELSFEKFEWTNDGLLIGSNTIYSNENVILYFKYNYFIINKFTTLGYENIKENEEIYPNVYISINNNKIDTKDYMFTWHPKDLRIFLKNDFEYDKTYDLEIVDNLKMHKFNYYKLNYFDKKLIVNFDVRNYDDYIINDDGSETLIENSRQKINNLNFNFSERDVRRNDDTYILKVAKAEPTDEYYYYESPISTYSYNLSGNNIRCDWNYIASFDTIYKHNNYFEYISLYSDTALNPTHVDKNTNETITYNLTYPLTNYYGWFIDSKSSNKSIVDFINLNEIKNIVRKKNNENDYSTHLKNMYSDFYRNERNVLRCRLINKNQSLSSDLIYQYSLKYQYVYNDYYGGYDDSYLYFDGSYQVDRPTYYSTGLNYKEEYTNFYSFMFKQKFDGDSTPPDDDWNTWGRGVRKAVIPGLYKMELYYNNSTNPIYVYDEIDLTKENEKLRNTYNVRLEFPFINFTGYILNKHSGNKEWRSGVQLKLTCLSDKTSQIPNLNENVNSIPGQYIYTFGNFEYCDENHETDDEHKFNYGRTNNKWQFLFQGFDYHHYFTWTENSLISEYKKYLTSSNNGTYNYSVGSNICAEAALPSGTYKLELRYRKNNISDEQFNDPSIPENEKYDIFYEDDNFILSKDNEEKGLLYDYVIESPFIDFNGTLYENIIGNNNVNILYGTDNQNAYNYSSIISGADWHVEMQNINEPEYTSTFSFKSLGNKQNFQFRGFGRLRSDSNNGGKTDMSDYFARGLISGTYNLIVKYKGKEIKRINDILLTKEDENLGKFDNVKINIGNIFTNISGHIVDSKFNDFVIDSQMVNVKEEEFTGDINDSQFPDKLENSNNKWAFDYYYYNQFYYNGKHSYKYEFNNLKRIGQYAIGVWDDYHEHYGLEWFKNPLKIKGIVKGKSLKELEGLSNFNYVTYKFDDYSKVSGSNIFIEANSGAESHKTFDLLSLKDITDSSKNLTYDIYLKYANTKFPYHIYYSKNDRRYELKVPIDLSLTEQYDVNDDEHIKLDNGNILGLTKINWTHTPVWYIDYSTYYLAGYTNNLSGYNELIKTGTYSFDIQISNTSSKVFANNEIEVSSSKYNVEREIDINSKNFKELNTVILTKYYSLDDDGPKYQVVKLDYSNLFKVTLEYSDDKTNWYKYYDFDSYSKNTEETELINYECSGQVLAISGWETDENTSPSSLPIRYTTTLSIFDQLHKNLFIRLSNPTLYGNKTEITGIYDDINLNGDVRDDSIIKEFIPTFIYDDGTTSNVSGHISSLFVNGNEYWYEENPLKRHLISGDYKRENNLLDSDNTFAVSSLTNYKSDIKILELKYLNVNIQGQLLANDGSSFDMNDMMKILIQLFKYDKNTNNETLIQEQYYLNNKFNFSNIETGFYKFRFFLGNIELFEKNRNTIHTFNYNETNYNIVLEKYFPSLSGNIYFKGFEDETLPSNSEIISINSSIAYYYPEVIGMYTLINNPKNKIDKIFKHTSKNIYILATTNRLMDYYGSVSWIITKFDHRIAAEEINKNPDDLDTFIISYNNRNDDPVESINYDSYYYYSYYYENGDEGWWETHWEYLSTDGSNDGIQYIEKTSKDVYLRAIDYVHLDIINNDLNDYNYYGFAYNVHSDYKAGYFSQNTAMNDEFYDDYSKFYLKNIVEGSYKIKYFIFPDGGYQYGYHWSYYGKTDARTNYIDLKNSSNEIAKTLYSNIMNILSGATSSNEINISTNDFWNMINSVSCDQLKEQFFKSEKLRTFRIQLNYSFNNNSSNERKYCFSLIKFEDEFPIGGLFNNLSDSKFVKLKINSKLEKLVPRNDVSNISWTWDTFEIQNLILSWADLMYEENISVSRNSKEIGTKYIDYMYTYETNLNCYGYNSKLHNNQNVKSEIYENDKLIVSERFSGENKTKSYYGLRSDTAYYCTYIRSSFILGDINVPYLYGRYNTITINCNKLYNLSGTIKNKSIEKCKNISDIDLIYNANDLKMRNPYRIDYRLIYRGGDDETLNQEIGTYFSGEYMEYNEYYNENWTDKYSFDSLLSGKYDIRYRARSWYDEHLYFNGNRTNWDNNTNETEYSLVSFEFKDENFNNTKNIELPCLNFTVTLEIVDNKDGSLMRYIPLSTIILNRNQKSIDSSDIYDEAFTGVYGKNNYSSPSYNQYQIFNVKSGYYDDINIKCTISGMTINETYERTVINEDRKFRVYGNCEITNIKIKVLKNGNLQPNAPVFIFDENKNLKNIVYTNQSGYITAPLKNIPYYFKAISQKQEFIFHEKINNSLKEIELSY